MSYRSQVMMAFMVAMILTAVGWQQVMIYKTPSILKIMVWFPSLLLIPLNDDLLQVFITLVQFPLLSAGFALGIRRWNVWSVSIALMSFYALCVVAAFAVIYIAR